MSKNIFVFVEQRNGKIQKVSLELIGEATKLAADLGEQVVAVSQKAFDAISFEEAIAVPREIYYPKKLARDTDAREDFQKEKSRGSILTETYILDIIRQGWKNDDERLQRVVLG